ncbi:MAG: hypothetical protein HYY16_18050 [Planctomycetes bacterium]|nr:hypothetical protein [Planctomycetota bacterium]
MSIARGNVIVGLVLIAAGLFFGSFMAAARDISVIGEWLRWPAIRSNQVMYAHAHLGVIGLTNVALGLVLPLTALSRVLRAAVSWAAIVSGVLVPAGMMLALLPEPWDRLVYVQAAGFVSLLFSVGASAWGVFRARGAAMG